MIAPKTLLRIAAALLAGIFPIIPDVPQTLPVRLQQRPKLVVVVVVDQMRADYVARFHDRWHGGLRRLVDQGAWLTNAAYPYAETETCPGHATISTGVFPAKSGIVGNTWYDRQSSKVVTCTQDSSVHNVGITRTTTTAGDSAAAVQVSGIAEQLRSAIAGSRSVAISFKARAAIMLAGHRADAVLWNDETTGELLTSTAYASEFPNFARQFVLNDSLNADFSKVWTPFAPTASYTGSRSVQGEAPPPGWTATFPHPLAASDKSPGSAFVLRWRTSPFADAWLERLASAAIDDVKLGKGNGVDFLGISFSATDYIGHAFGPYSREMEDQMFQLDQTIGALLAKLDTTVGEGNYVVALTADHGVAPIPEQAKAQGVDAGRVNSASLVGRMEKAISARLGSSRHIAQVIGSDFYLAPEVRNRIDSDAALFSAITEAALQEPGVQNVVRRVNKAVTSSADALTRALSFDVFPERSGDLWIDLKPGWIFSARAADGWTGGTTHGSHYDYDQRVPIVLFGTGIKQGRYTMSATPADIAPTLASLAGFRIARSEGRILTEALIPRVITRP